MILILSLNYLYLYYAYVYLYLDKIKKYDPYLILDEISIPHSKFLKVLDRYLKEKDIEGIVTTSNKFLDVDTIVKVK